MTRWPDLGFRERILPFDSPAIQVYADTVAGGRYAGRPIGKADCHIAAICHSKIATPITRNVRGFGGADIRFANPRVAV